MTEINVIRGRGLLARARRPALLLFALAAGLQAAQASAGEARSTHYEWFTAGQVSGSLLLQLRDDGSRVADFEFNDRWYDPAQLHETVGIKPFTC